jgi:hypothetical protein
MALRHFGLANAPVYSLKYTNTALEISSFHWQEAASKVRDRSRRELNHCNTPSGFPKGASIGVCSEYPTTVSSALTVWGLTCSQGTTLDMAMRDAWPVLHRKGWHGRSSLLGSLASQRRDAIRRKAAPAHPLSSPIFRRWRKVDEKEST